MSKGLCKFGITLLLLFGCSIQFQITKVESYEYNDFSLSKPGDISSASYYKIFRFKNVIPSPYEKTDLILQFKLGQGYTSRIAIYNDQSKISQNIIGDFIGYALFYESAEKEIVITKQESNYIGNGDFFIVIYDIEYTYVDSFRIFNEIDKITIKNNSCNSIPHLYGQNKLFFHLLKPEQSTYLSFSMSSSSTMIPTFIIKQKGEHLREYRSGNKNELLPIKADLEFEIVKQRGSYDAEFYLTFCVEALAKRVNVIGKEGAIQHYAYSMPYYFKMSLKPYSQHEENSIFLGLDYTKTDAFEGFYCKYIKEAAKTEDELLAIFPRKEEDNECAVQKDDLMSTSYHLYFNNSNTELETLLIYVKTKGEHNKGASFRISALQKIKDLSSNQYLKNIDLVVPLFFKINPNSIENNLIVSSSNEFYLSVIYESLSKGKSPTKAKYRTQLFSVNKKENGEGEPLPVIYIKLYGGLTTFEAFFTKSTVIGCQGDVRPLSSYHVEMNKYDKPVYFIGYYANKSNQLLSIETIYGKALVYYSDNYLSNTTIAENLPQQTSKALKEPIQLSKTVDLMTITSLIPTSIILHFTPQESQSKTLQVGDSVKTLLSPKQLIKHSLVLKPSSQIGIEAIMETDDTIVSIYFNDVKKAELNNSKKIYREIYSNDNSNSAETIAIRFESLSLSKDSIVAFKSGSNQLYSAVITETRTIKAQNILIELKDKDYYSVAISISSWETGLSFCFSQGINDSLFIPLSRINCHQLIGKYTLTLTNPFDKYFTLSGKYYVALAFNLIPTNEILIEIKYDNKESASLIESNKIALLNTTMARLRTVKSIDSSKTFTAFSFIPCNKQKIDYSISFNKEQLIEDKGVSSSTTAFMNNLLAELDLKVSEGNLFSYDYITQKTYDEYQKRTLNYKLDLSTNSRRIKLKFEPFIKGKSVRYDFFVLKSNKTEEVSDACALFMLKPNKTQTFQKSDGVIEHEITVNETGVYQVNILSSIEEISTIKAYNAMEIIVNKDQTPAAETKKLLWIIIGSIGGVLVIIVVVVIIIMVRSKRRNDQEQPQAFDFLEDGNKSFEINK